MINQFNQMPPNAKVWIYASDKIISPSQLAVINQKAIPFIQNWTAHQNQLKAEFTVLYHCFLVFMVDEGVHEISGCGIDKLTHLIREIDAATNLNLFNRMGVQLLENNEVTCLTKSEFLVKLAAQNLGNSKAFNNQVTTKNQFEMEWIIPLENAWYYPKTKLQSV
ncbi:MAG: hypothetical protein K9G64_03735 [Bacteroidia bacterium]|nr:hypothetical protein [Bacteroidia bacterium]